MSKVITELFLLLHCERNSDGTKNLILKGHDLQLRIKKRLHDRDVIKLCFFLQKYKEVVHLDVCYNNIGDAGLEEFVDRYLSQENNLVYLNLVGCDITSKGIKYLCENVPNLTLNDLRLNGNKIGVEGGQALALYLNNNVYIEHLDIGETDQTLQSISYYMKILNHEQGENKTIKVLNLSRIIPCFNRYNYNPEHLANSVSGLLSSNKTLVELHLQKCQLDGHDIEIIVNGLQKNKVLLFLNIGYNKIGDYGIESLANYLKNRPPLLGLNVAANGIKDTGARALSFGMPFSRIRLLDIGHNHITDSGILDILNTIKKPVQIRILNIWGNKITHKTNIVIKRMFKSGVLNQDFVDVSIYEVDKVLHAAYNPSDRYKHKYYCELDYGVAMPVVIKKNKIPPQSKKRLDFKFYPVIPGYVPVERKPEHNDDCHCCRCKY